MTNKATKFWNVATSGDGKQGTIDLCGELTAEPVRLYLGDAAEGRFYTSEDFKNDLAAVAGCKEITVNINSVGGDLYVGLAIHNALKALPGKVRTVIQGIAASAASVIFCAGDEREVFDGSLLMVHGVRCFSLVEGYFCEREYDNIIRELKQEREAVRVMNDAVAAIYAGATGKSKDECLDLISGDSEKWLTGADAIAEGFATGYTAANGKAAPLKLVACGGKTALYSGKTLLSKDFHAPQNAAELGITTAPAPAAGEETQTNTTMDNETEKTPEAVPAPAVDTAAVAAQARKAERERMAAINALADKLGGRVSKELVNAALYGNGEHDGMTPEAFAHEAVMALAPEPVREPAENAAFLQARAAELAPANNLQTAAPTATAETEANNGLAILARMKANQN